MNSRLFRPAAAPVQPVPVGLALGEEHPREFLCPISLELMTDPVVTSTGHTFERASIEAWFATGRTTNPITGLRLASRDLTPNFALRDAIATYNRERAQEVPVAPSPDEEIYRVLYQSANQFVEALENQISTGTIREELGLDENAAKAYVATVFGLIRKKNLGLLLLPNTEETCCIPESLVRFITAFVMDHGVLMLAQQHLDFCKTAIEVPLNKGEALPDVADPESGRALRK